EGFAVARLRLGGGRRCSSLGGRTGNGAWRTLLPLSAAWAAGRRDLQNTCQRTRLLPVLEAGRADSNRRPPAPKAGALTRLRYVPMQCVYPRAIALPAAVSAPRRDICHASQEISGRDLCFHTAHSWPD